MAGILERYPESNSQHGTFLVLAYDKQDDSEIRELFFEVPTADVESFIHEAQASDEISAVQLHNTRAKLIKTDCQLYAGVMVGPYFVDIDFSADEEKPGVWHLSDFNIDNLPDRPIGLKDDQKVPIIEHLNSWMAEAQACLSSLGATEIRLTACDARTEALWSRYGFEKFEDYGDDGCGMVKFL